MQNVQPSLFARGDTLLGVCQGLSEDLGFNPLLPRLALTFLLFFQPVAALAIYGALGAVVLLSRLLVPNPRFSASQAARRDPAIAGEAELERLAA